jgi:hypothetical protein
MWPRTPENLSDRQQGAARWRQSAALPDVYIIAIVTSVTHQPHLATLLIDPIEQVESGALTCEASEVVITPSATPQSGQAHAARLFLGVAFDKSRQAALQILSPSHSRLSLIVAAPALWSPLGSLSRPAAASERCLTSVRRCSPRNVARAACSGPLAVACFTFFFAMRRMYDARGEGAGALPTRAATRRFARDHGSCKRPFFLLVVGRVGRLRGAARLASGCSAEETGCRSRGALSSSRDGGRSERSSRRCASSPRATPTSSRATAPSAGSGGSSSHPRRSLGVLRRLRRVHLPGWGHSAPS